MGNFKPLLLTSIATLIAINSVSAQTPQPANPPATQQPPSVKPQPAASPPKPVPPKNQPAGPPGSQKTPLTAQEIQVLQQLLAIVQQQLQQAAPPVTPAPAPVPAQPAAPPAPAAADTTTPKPAVPPGAGAANANSTVTVTNTPNGDEITLGSTAVQAANIPNSDSNYFDDGLIWGVDIPAWSDTSKAAPDLCIPANTRIMGRGSLPVTTVTVPPAAKAAAKQNADNADQDTGTGSAPAQATPTEYLPVQLNPTHYLSLFPPDIYGPQKAVNFDPAGTKTEPNAQEADQVRCVINGTPKGTIYPGQMFYVSYAQLQTVDYRSGFDYGALVVPFKVQLSGTKSISTSASLGGYLGYNFPLMNTGVTFRPIVFAGASSISTATTSGSTTSSQTLAGLTYGTGVITQIKDSSFQVGLILGFDHVDSTQTYVFNDKPWMSLEVGYSFTR